MEGIEAALIAQIAEDPASDGPRLALADFYAERDDPRGELMSLQLAEHPLGPHKTRLAKLLRAHGSRMVGTLVDILKPTSLRFERGRLSACSTVFHHNDQRVAALGNPFWATVVELETDDGTLPTDETMRSLRTLRGLRINAFAGLCRNSHPLPIETVELGFGLSLGTHEDRHAVAHTQALPRLRRLELALGYDERVTAQRLHWLLASPLGQQLDELAIHSYDRGGSGVSDYPPVQVVRARATRLEIDKASFAEFRRSWPRPLRFEL